MIEMAAIGSQFIDAMKKYQDSQEACEGFEGAYELFDLYEDLCYIYDSKPKNSDSYD